MEINITEKTTCETCVSPYVCFLRLLWLASQSISLWAVLTDDIMGGVRVAGDGEAGVGIGGVGVGLDPEQ